MKMLPTPSDMPIEGAIQFHLDFDLAQPEAPENAAELNAWRQILYRLGLTGQAPDRYEGLAYGNVSQRTDLRGFFVSGTRTGGKPLLGIADYCQVLDFDIAQNWIRAKGLVEPSSESLTHGAVYEANPHAGCVIHVHSPEIWRNALHLGLHVTDAAITYGTPDMGLAVGKAAARETAGIIAMGGHEDGALAYAGTAGQAAVLLLRALEKAVEFEQRMRFINNVPSSQSR